MIMMFDHIESSTPHIDDPEWWDVDDEETEPEDDVDDMFSDTFDDPHSY